MNLGALSISSGMLRRICVAIVSDDPCRAVEIATPLRRSGIATLTSWSGKVSRQIRRMMDVNNPIWLVIIEQGAITLRNTRNGLQHPITFDALIEGMRLYFDDFADDDTDLVEALCYDAETLGQFKDMFPNAEQPITLEQYKSGVRRAPEGGAA